MKFKTGYIPDPQSCKSASRRAVSGGRFASDYPMRILIAEDDTMCREAMGMFLETLGYCPTMVENGKECLAQVSRGSFDLILTDLEMPEMTGIECAREIRRLGLGVFIVAVTACSSPNARQHCVAAGMNGYLAKPFDGAELKTVLRTAYASIKAKSALMV